MRIFGTVIAVGIAIAYYFFWPGRRDPNRVSQRPLWSHIVLRWFHSLTWILIAMACFFWMKFAAVLAGVVYLIFIVALAQERRAAKGT